MRYLDRVIAELEQNVRDRQQVSAYYRSRTRLCQPKSQVEKDNEDKRFFTELLESVLQILRDTAARRSSATRPAS